MGYPSIGSSLGNGGGLLCLAVAEAVEDGEELGALVALDDDLTVLGRATDATALT